MGLFARCLFDNDSSSFRSIGPDKQESLLALTWNCCQNDDRLQTYCQNYNNLPSPQPLKSLLLFCYHVKNESGGLGYVLLVVELAEGEAEVGVGGFFGEAEGE